jgi:hypothetical protein
LNGVTTNDQLLSLSDCTSIDNLVIICADCTQAAWCGLQLQSISGKTDPGVSLFLILTPAFTDMCGIKNVKGPLAGSLTATSMNGLVSMDGTEGITSLGTSAGISIKLDSNPVLTSTIALVNAKYPDDSLFIHNNTKLECVPSAWPAVDSNGVTIPHGSCPSLGDVSAGLDLVIVIAIIGGLAFAAGLVYYWRRRSAENEDNPLQKPLLRDDALEMDVLEKQLPKEPAFAKTQAEKDACVASWRQSRLATSQLHPGHRLVADSQLQVDFNDIKLDLAARESIIGDGGSCKVYKTSVYGMVCAVKMLSTNASAWEEQQFDSEVKLLSAVRHTNLCRFYACSTNGPQKCVLLELMDISLDKRLVAEGEKLGWQQCVWIALCMCRGLCHLHSLVPPIIHR